VDDPAIELVYRDGFCLCDRADGGMLQVFLKR